MNKGEKAKPSEDFTLKQQAKVRSTRPWRRVHGEFVNYAAIGIWNRPRQWYRQA